MPRLWRTSPVPANDGAPKWVDADDPLLEALPSGRRQRGGEATTATTTTTTAATGGARNASLPFTERVALVRLLGGWTSGDAPNAR